MATCAPVSPPAPATDVPLNGSAWVTPVHVVEAVTVRATAGAADKVSRTAWVDVTRAWRTPAVDANTEHSVSSPSAR